MYVYKKLKVNYNFRKQKLKYITTASKAMTAALQRITANEINKPTCYKVEGSSGSLIHIWVKLNKFILKT